MLLSTCFCVKHCIVAKKWRRTWLFNTQIGLTKPQFLKGFPQTVLLTIYSKNSPEKKQKSNLNLFLDKCVWQKRIETKSVSQFRLQKSTSAASISFKNSTSWLDPTKGRMPQGQPWEFRLPNPPNPESHHTHLYKSIFLFKKRKTTIAQI